MHQEERRIYLIKELLQEYTSCSRPDIPKDPVRQKMLLRGLLNVRRPAAVSRKFLEVQDAYLQTELAGKRITDCPINYALFSSLFAFSLNDLV